MSSIMHFGENRAEAFFFFFFWLAVYLSANHAAVLLIQEDVKQRAPQTSADVLTAGTQSLAPAGHRGQSCT